MVGAILTYCRSVLSQREPPSVFGYMLWVWVVVGREFCMMWAKLERRVSFEKLYERSAKQ